MTCLPYQKITLASYLETILSLKSLATGRHCLFYINHPWWSQCFASHKNANNEATSILLDFALHILEPSKIHMKTSCSYSDTAMCERTQYITDLRTTKHYVYKCWMLLQALRHLNLSGLWMLINFVEMLLCITHLKLNLLYLLPFLASDSVKQTWTHTKMFCWRLLHLYLFSWCGSGRELAYQLIPFHV